MLQLKGPSHFKMVDSEINDDAPPRIFLWCVPRSCSTALTKMMSFVDGAEIWFEPYVMSWHRKFNWFELVEKPEVATAMKETLASYANSIPKSKWGNMRPWSSFSYEPNKLIFERKPQNPETKFIFIKDMAFAIDGQFEYLPETVPSKHVFLIRHPHRFLPSYRAAMRKLLTLSPTEEYKHGDSDMVLQGDKGTDQVFSVWKYIRENIDPNPIVVDTEDILKNPSAILPKLFHNLGITWKDSYLKWKEDKSVMRTWISGLEYIGSEASNGMFERALSSGHFISDDKPLLQKNDMHPDIAKFVDRFMPGYTEMKKHALT